jgi:hypothetical protein
MANQLIPIDKALSDIVSDINNCIKSFSDEDKEHLNKAFYHWLFCNFTL